MTSHFLMIIRSSLMWFTLIVIENLMKVRFLKVTSLTWSLKYMIFSEMLWMTFEVSQFWFLMRDFWETSTSFWKVSINFLMIIAKFADRAIEDFAEFLTDFSEIWKKFWNKQMRTLAVLLLLKKMQSLKAFFQ